MMWFRYAWKVAWVTVEFVWFSTDGREQDAAQRCGVLGQGAERNRTLVVPLGALDVDFDTPSE